MSNGRVLAAADVSSEGDLTLARIPVRFPNPGDKKDVALRNHARDWLRLQRKDLGVDTRFEKLPAGVVYAQGEEETPVQAMLVLSWWPKPEESLPRQ